MPQTFNRLYFRDPMRGWAVGGEAIFKTEDGGKSWEKLELSGTIKDMFFLDSHKGIAISNESIFAINL